ncbi:MAG: substrate-binding domain-containing protein, partial [Sedimentisphaerales bacterium]|nr:substrate-binding domain-containing protein [Sedimentisphaerales bacterium]
FEAMIWSQLRLDGFVHRIRQAGFLVDPFVCSVERSVHPTEKEQRRLIRWLRDLPKPVGLMTCNDDMGRTVLENCKFAGIHVPEQIAVVGVDNDDLTCELTDPQLSSVALDSEKAGYQAAELLDRLMQGEPMNGQIISHDPTHVVTRHSTDILAVADGDVANALRFIRDHIRQPIQVDDVTEHIAMTRQGLNKKFHKCLNRTVHQEIIRARIQQITHMLMETSMSISDIAHSMGYAEMKYISRLFHRETGLSPSQYRRKFGTK